MEPPNCAVAVRSTVSHPVSSASRSREYNENSLNAALSFQLYASASSRYNSLQTENGSVLRDGYLAAPVFPSHNRPFITTLPSPNHPRDISDILDEAINLSNDLLLEDINNDPRVVSSFLLHQQQQSHNIVNRSGQRRKRKVQERCLDKPQQWRLQWFILHIHRIIIMKKIKIYISGLCSGASLFCL